MAESHTHVFVSLTPISPAGPLKLPVLVFLLHLVAFIGVIKNPGQWGRREPAVSLPQRCGRGGSRASRSAALWGGCRPNGTEVQLWGPQGWGWQAGLSELSSVYLLVLDRRPSPVTFVFAFNR